MAPNSADLEPIDHAVRLGTAQRVCHSKKFDAIDQLKQAIVPEFIINIIIIDIFKVA